MYYRTNRVTKITYPDGTTDISTYSNLDLASFQDRQGRVWTYTHDANRRLTKMTDPLGQQTLYAYNGLDEHTSLTDPKGAVTSWTYDVEGRLTSKKYADTSTVAYVYENTTSRLHAVTDALGQVKQNSYTQDNRLASTIYSNAVNPTSNLSFTYDPYFPRVASMTDGNGVTQYSYVAPFSLGALQPQQECFTPTGATSCSFQINYAYDALGRRSSRTVTGAGAETFQYDAIGRLASHASDLGSFALSYLGQTEQTTQRQLASSSLATNWSYLPNSGDRRLAEISNVGLSPSQFSIYQFATKPENFISGITETSDASTVYPNPATQTASYNSLNQLANLSGQALSYDANGNLLSDGQRNYSWDAENRLVGIAYPGQPGKQTTFAYDGFNRRTAISSTPAGGGSGVTTSYIWCGAGACQARDTNNSPTREYLAEGEFVPGAPGQPYYYGLDQIGSVHRVFASATSAPAYSNDPYGDPLQATVPLTDFGYAGMFYNADNGLYLTAYRAYDPAAGRWLSRDPSGEIGDPAANLYRYVNDDPINLTDRLGLDPVGAAIGGVIGRIAGGVAGTIGGELLDPLGGGIPGEMAGNYAGGLAGRAAGDALGDAVLGTLFNRPPRDATDPNGAKAPGQPGPDEGFCPPKRGQPQWGRSPNGNDNGWIDADGNVWVPTGPDLPGNNAHGGPTLGCAAPGRRIYQCVSWPKYQ